MKQHVRMLWVLAGTVVLAGSVAAIAVFFLRRIDDSQETPSSTLVLAELNYDCRDKETVAALREIPRGDHGFDWIGNVGIYLPPDAPGHNVTVLGGGARGPVKMAVVVREGVEFRTITMDGVEGRTGEPLSFDYAGVGYARGPVTYERPSPIRPFYGAFQVPKLGVYRLSYALDGVPQGSTVLALCRTE